MNEPIKKPKGLLHSRSLKYADPWLAERVLLMEREACKVHGRQLIRTTTWRGIQKQGELYLIGRRDVEGERIVTNCDGIKYLSYHNYFPSLAVDFAVDKDPGIGQKITWEVEEYELIGYLAKKYGLIWGGDFSGKFKDRPHVQVPKVILAQRRRVV